MERRTRTVLSRAELGRLEALGEAIERAAETVRAPGERAPYHDLLAPIATTIGATRVTVHRPVVNATGWDLEYHSYWSAYAGAENEQLRFRALVRQKKHAYVFDPRVPQLAQRNRVVNLDELDTKGVGLRPLAAATGVGAGFTDQLRVLVCQGPRLLAFVAGFRESRFDEHDRAALVGLLPALRRVHAADFAARERAFLTAGIEGALEALAEPAFLLDQSGTIRHASRSGEAWLARTPEARDRIRAISRGELEGGTTHLLPEGKGAVVVVRTSGAAPSVRLRRAQLTWDLTQRQMQVLGHVASGDTNKSVANSLRCSEANVELHVTNILRRTGSANRSELLAKFWRL